MCSCLAQIIYGVVLFFALIFAITAFSTPKWSELSSEDNSIDVELLREKYPGASSEALWPRKCLENDDVTKRDKVCEHWFAKKEIWEKVCVVCLVLAAIVAGVALIWNFFTCCTCCCKTKRLLYPLPSFAAAFTLLVLICLVLFAINNKERFHNNSALKEAMRNDPDFKDKDVDKLASSFGYSFGCCVFSLVLGFGAIIVGGLAICCTTNK